MPRYPNLDIIGHTGLNYTGGYINEEWLTKLSGDRAIRAYKEMRDNDAIIGAILYAIKSLVRQVPWAVEENHSGHPQAERAAEFLRECAFDDMSLTWEDLISEIMSMLVFGFSAFEIVYKVRRGPDSRSPKYRSNYSDGLIGWRKIATRSQDSITEWVLDEDGGIRGFYQNASPNYQTVFIPIEKALLFRTEVNKNNPEGRSLLRNAYRSYFFLKRIQELEAIGIERELAGLPVLQVPPEIMMPNAKAEQKTLRNNLETLIQQIRRDEREGVLMPSEVDSDNRPTGFKLSLLSTGGRRQIDTNETIKRYESRIAMSVLAEFILLGTDSHGSFALASSKTDLFASALGGMLDSIEAVMNRFAVARLMKLNPVFPREAWPRFKHGDIEKAPLDEVGSFIQRIAGANLITPDAAVEERLREMAGLPQIGPETELVEELAEEEELQDEEDALQDS
tara:strand:+ start:964 stop:2316 length:1353 start_codon:yes stop_codon:yes gene_type:complete